MRKGLWLVLVAAAVAAAAGIGNAATGRSAALDPVSAAFTAASTGESRSQTCTSRAGVAYTTTNGVYRGAWTGDERLAGTLTIRSRSVVNAATGDGALNARLVVAGADGRAHAKLHLSAIVDGGTYAGWISGKVRKAGDEPGGALRASITGSLGDTLSGRLGGADGVAVVVGHVGCKSGDAAKTGERSRDGTKTRAERRSASGAITALSATSITVADLTCSVGADAAARLARSGVAVGTRVRISCVAHEGGWRLAKLGRA